jgi:hypothetical protein
MQSHALHVADDLRNSCVSAADRAKFRQCTGMSVDNVASMLQRPDTRTQHPDVPLLHANVGRLPPQYAKKVEQILGGRQATNDDILAVVLLFVLVWYVMRSRKPSQGHAPSQDYAPSQGHALEGKSVPPAKEEPEEGEGKYDKSWPLIVEEGPPPAAAPAEAEPAAAPVEEEGPPAAALAEEGPAPAAALAEEGPAPAAAPAAALAEEEPVSARFAQTTWNTDMLNSQAEALTKRQAEALTKRQAEALIARWREGNLQPDSRQSPYPHMGGSVAVSVAVCVAVCVTITLLLVAITLIWTKKGQYTGPISYPAAPSRECSSSLLGVSRASR